MIRLSLFVLALVMGLSLSVASVHAVAAEKGAPEIKKPEISNLVGTVKSLGDNGTSFVVTSGKGDTSKETTVTVNADTKYSIDGKESTMAEVVKVGARVKVAHKDGVATTVAAWAPKPKTEKPKADKPH